MKEGRRRIDIEEEWTKTNRLQATTSEKGFFSSRNHFPPFALAPTTFRAFSAEIARRAWTARGTKINNVNANDVNL